MSSKLINTTSANHISFPTISLFPHAQNYIHIYFTINAISFPQKLKTTLTYAINVSAIDGSAYLSVTMDAFRNHPTHHSLSRSNSNSTYRARNTWERNLWIRKRVSVLVWHVRHDVSSFLLISDAFAELMSSGTLACQSHISIPSSSQDFPSLVKSICQSYRLTGTGIASRLSSRGWKPILHTSSCGSNRVSSVALFGNHPWPTHRSSTEIDGRSSRFLRALTLFVFSFVAEFSAWPIDRW